MADENITNQTPEPKSAEQVELEAVEANLRKNPGMIPDQFKQGGGDPVTKFMESYKELRSKFTQTAQELSELRKATPTPSNPQPASEAPGGSGTVSELGIPKPPEPQSGPDVWSVVEDEVNKTGDLSQATRDAVLKTGVKATVLDAALRGIKADRQATLTEAKQMVGGDQNLAAIQQWAAKNLPPEEAVVADAALKDPRLWRTTLMGLYSRWQQSSPTHGEPRPTPTGTAGPGHPGVHPFRDEADMRAAFADPRYRDPHNESFRKEVALRLEATMRQRGS